MYKNSISFHSTIICVIASKRLFGCLHNPNESFRPQYSKMNFNSHVTQIRLDKPLYVCIHIHPIIIIQVYYRFPDFHIYENNFRKENQKIFLFFNIPHLEKGFQTSSFNYTHVLEYMCANYKLVRVYILNWIIYQRPKRNVLYNKCVDIFIRKGYTHNDYNKFKYTHTIQ